MTLWPDATADEHRRLLASIFERIETDERGFSAGRLREGWRPYVATVLRLYQERKTGLERAVRARAVRTLRVRDGGLDLLRRAA
ncbi:MAG TPA: hypothetical protein VGS17_05070 [Candidatus Limnocylindria bacterium]|nr:hypothetical protein [Candidatus Limnocylindria bacterium]